MRFSSANAVCFVVVDSLSRTMQTPFPEENWIYLVTNAIIINSQETLDFRDGSVLMKSAFGNILGFRLQDKLLKFFTRNPIFVVEY